MSCSCRKRINSGRPIRFEKSEILSLTLALDVRILSVSCDDAANKKAETVKNKGFLLLFCSLFVSFFVFIMFVSGSLLTIKSSLPSD